MQRLWAPTDHLLHPPWLRMQNVKAPVWDPPPHPHPSYGEKTAFCGCAPRFRYAETREAAHLEAVLCQTWSSTHPRSAAWSTQMRGCVPASSAWIMQLMSLRSGMAHSAGVVTHESRALLASFSHKTAFTVVSWKGGDVRACAQPRALVSSSRVPRHWFSVRPICQENTEGVRRRAAVRRRASMELLSDGLYWVKCPLCGTPSRKTEAEKLPALHGFPSSPLFSNICNHLICHYSRFRGDPPPIRAFT